MQNQAILSKKVSVAYAKLNNIKRKTCERVLNVIMRHPGSPANEVAQRILNTPYAEISMALRDLNAAGVIDVIKDGKKRLSYPNCDRIEQINRITKELAG